jgi:hypothetical protein
MAAASCWPRVMQVGLIADAEIRDSRHVSSSQSLGGSAGCRRFGVVLRARQGRPRYAGRPTIACYSFGLNKLFGDYQLNDFSFTFAGDNEKGKVTLSHNLVFAHQTDIASHVAS